MWLEELAWFWLPVVSGLGIWFVRSHIMLRREVRELRKRVEWIESGGTARGEVRNEAA